MMHYSSSLLVAAVLAPLVSAVVAVLAPLASYAVVAALAKMVLFNLQ